MSLKTSNDKICLVDDISAYLDGELSAAGEIALETHLAGCPECRLALNEQKQLLMMIDGSLDRTIDPPLGFTRTIVANAESHVRGLRDRRQIFPAFLVILSLCLFALLLMPLGEIVETAVPLRDAIVHIPTLLRMAGGMIADVLFGISVFIRPATFSTTTYIVIPVLFCGFLAALIVTSKLKSISVRNDTK